MPSTSGRRRTVTEIVPSAPIIITFGIVLHFSIFPNLSQTKSIASFSRSRVVGGPVSLGTARDASKLFVEIIWRRAFDKKIRH